VFSQSRVQAAPMRGLPGRESVGVEPTFSTKVGLGPERFTAAIEQAHAQDRAPDRRQAADRFKTELG
jgi:hypothetical protein